MAILHGSWLIENHSLFIWGETWRALSRIAPSSTENLDHPLAMTPVELNEWLHKTDFLPQVSRDILKSALPVTETATTERTRKGKSRQATGVVEIARSPTAIFALPTDPDTGYPVHSAASQDADYTLKPWRVQGLLLEPLAAFQFLSSLPLGSASQVDEYLGGDLRFWSHVARWSLALLSRCKFLPALEKFDDSFKASWRSLLDSAIDTSRLEKFAKVIPGVCLAYRTGAADNDDATQPSPQEVILSFLDSTIDVQIRTILNGTIPPNAPSPIPEWLQALTTPDKIVKAAPNQLERLVAVLNAWTAPLQYQINQAQIRTCFILHPPATGNEWTLAYGLQAASDPEFVVDAASVWRHPVAEWVIGDRTIHQPQETLLRGLGLASRLFAPIAASLDEQYPTSCCLTPLEAYEFIKSIAAKFTDSGLGVILPPSLANREGWANRLGLKIRAVTPRQKQGVGLQSLLNFEWELAIGGQTLSKAEFDRLVALNSPLVEINGEWVELRPQDIKTAQSFFASRKDKLSLSLEDALRLSTGDSLVIEKLPVVDFEATGALQELMSALTNNQAIALLPPPKSFQGELRPYQIRGFSWLAFLERWNLGACLADDMGLGKTIQFIAFMLHQKEQGALENPTLLVCPTSVLGNWEREVKKFAPQLKVMLHHGDKRPKGKTFVTAARKHDLVITSYALIHRDLKDLQSVSWQGIVLDEAQNIKNPEAKQSQSIRQLESSFRIALTGTPVENRLQELWSILDFLNPGYLGTRQFFQRRFAMPIEKYGDVDSLTQLRSLVQPFILRRVKTDRDIIQDLPEKQEMTEFCGISPEQAALYQQVVEESLAEIESAEGLQRRGMILALLVKLKQICNHPVLYFKQDKITQPRQSGKLLRLGEMLEEALAEGDRALIFTQFAEWGKLLQPYLQQHLQREILFLYGSTSKKQREEIIDRFQHDPQGPPIMILSLKAGGVGLNLTRANHVFHFDRWWNPAVENQATDRVFRIGQTRNVLVHKFVCTGTLEEKIHEMIESKKALAEQVVGAGEQWLTELDTDQLRNLLVLDRNAVIDEDAE
ncbi:DEAD/DEAH box helicase [Chroococcidiopsis sp. TS-821]|uniref:DEAD/DEAH box helicase n=1 Tax=Chroococcidiopsis sp. TS-821 TaxID=1378066 RepID=UPI000CED8E5E|nr:DEAD/DEAH box helicase [Chroococcidiopsis sp. TS-821]PPS43858.1 ATP-dependent helicase [Chroococcidiopsis sp. TS-821]